MRKIILVTGGCGFRGASFIKNHYKKYNKKDIIISIDKEEGQHISNEAYKKSHNLTFVEGNICNEELIKHLFDYFKITNVINFAEEKRSWKYDEMIETNSKGVEVLLECARKYWKSHTNSFIQSSTLKLYENKEETTEHTYNESKTHAEKLCRVCSEKYDINTNICRISNVFGPLHVDDFNISTNNNIMKLKVEGASTTVNDWIYIDDMCEIIGLLMESSKKNETYDICSNHHISNKVMSESIMDIVPKISNFTVNRMFTVRNETNNVPVNNTTSIEKTKKDLKWLPQNKNMFYENLTKTIIGFLR